DPVDEELHCQLMDGFAVIVQLILAVMALSSLLIKRAREHPQRPVRIWLFDVSKQALGGLILHTSNLLGAYFGGQSTVEQSNPCIWYFLNILLDTTIGVGIVWLALGQLTKLAERLDWPDTRSGYYGNPPRISAWCRQALLFFASLLIMKVIIVFLLTYVSIFFTLGSWILWPLALTQSPHLQVIVVMLIFPLIMNIMQFWLVDGVIK
ncbi:MAG: vacuolar membrane protein-domain-containing protein, partial [Piptocephalis tieghemiana]